MIRCHWNSQFALLAVLLLAVAGCPSDPEEIDLDDAGTPTGDTGEPIDDAGVPDDTGELDVGDDVDPEPDAPDPEPDAEEDIDTYEPPPLDCTVPGGNKTLAEAVAADCPTIEIVGDVAGDDLGIGEDPIAVEESVTVAGDGHTVFAPDEGLFSVIGDGIRLTLQDLDIRPADDGAPEQGQEGEEGATSEDEPNAVVAVTAGSALSTDNVTFEEFRDVHRSLLHADGADTVQLQSTTITDNESSQPLLHIEDAGDLELTESHVDANDFERSSIVACSNSSLAFGGGSTVDENTLEHDDSGEPVQPLPVSDSTTEMKTTAVVSLTDCDLTLDDTDVAGNEMLLTVIGHDAATIQCSGESDVEITGGSAITENHVTIDVDFAKGNLEYGAAGLHLDGCQTTIDDAFIGGNTKTITIEDLWSEMGAGQEGEPPDEYEVTVRGVGLHVADASVVVTNSEIVANTLNLSVNNDNERRNLLVDASGAGIDAVDSTVDITGSGVVDNGVEVAVDGFISSDSGNRVLYGSGVAIEDSSSALHQITKSTVADNYLGFDDSNPISSVSAGMGAGIFFETTAAAELRIKESTLNGNRIDYAHDSYGAGLAFITDGDGQLQMVNSTISGNDIEDSFEARGAGLYLQAPNLSGDYDTVVDFETLKAELWETPEQPPSPLSAVVRYSTIANNSIDVGNEDRGAGAGIYVSTDDTHESGPFISLVGLLLHENNRDGEVYDCDGSATFADIDDPDGDTWPDADAPDWGSGYNLISFSSGSENFDCSTMLGGFEIHDAADEDFSLATLDIPNDEATTAVHIPNDVPDGAVDAGQPGTCSYLINGDPLTYDQTGFDDRPENGDCDIGAVEWRPELD